MNSKKLITVLFVVSALATSQIANAMTCGGGCSTGSTPGTPLIGTSITGGGWSFSTTNTGSTIFFDPAVAIGYFYDSNIAFSGVTVGFPYGDDLYDLSVWNGSGALNDVASYTSLMHNWNGNLYNFASNNITKILISGIETSAAIDPANPTGFVTGFTFNTGSTINLTQIPLTTYVPEPQTWLLLGLGLLGMGAMRTKSSK